MTTLIGYRWKGSNVRSRVVLIVRQACAHACPRLGGGGNDLYFFLFIHTLYLWFTCSYLLRKTLSHYYVIAPKRALKYSKFRWPWRLGPPLTIPNREVKPVSADGTAIPSGRVGRRLFRSPLQECKGLFLFCF